MPVKRSKKTGNSSSVAATVSAPVTDAYEDKAHAALMNLSAVNPHRGAQLRTFRQDFKGNIINIEGITPTEIRRKMIEFDTSKGILSLSASARSRFIKSADMGPVAVTAKLQPTPQLPVLVKPKERTPTAAQMGVPGNSAHIADYDGRMKAATQLQASRRPTSSMATSSAAFSKLMGTEEMSTDDEIRTLELLREGSERPEDFDKRLIALKEAKAKAAKLAAKQAGKSEGPAPVREEFDDPDTIRTFDDKRMDITSGGLLRNALKMVGSDLGGIFAVAKGSRAQYEQKLASMDETLARLKESNARMTRAAATVASRISTQSDLDKKTSQRTAKGGWQRGKRGGEFRMTASGEKEWKDKSNE